jgi:hypothetical protein
MHYNPFKALAEHNLPGALDFCQACQHFANGDKFRHTPDNSIVPGFDTNPRLAVVDSAVKALTRFKQNIESARDDAIPEKAKVDLDAAAQSMALAIQSMGSERTVAPKGGDKTLHP